MMAYDWNIYSPVTMYISKDDSIEEIPIPIATPMQLEIETNIILAMEDLPMDMAMPRLSDVMI